MNEEFNSDKFIVFKVANHLLALPIHQVIKVVNRSEIKINKFTTMGLIQIGRHMIKLLDLHQQLNTESLSHASNPQSFLVITYDAQRELCGVLVDEPPDLMELPPEIVQPLPKSDNYSKFAIEMVSHVAVLTQKNLTQTIFLLNFQHTTVIS
ncbi:MAG: chemotaxis protein CheW [Scytonema sp. PMC 1069.18]|nr:chemotaxis protein CheW [Scytonema sp. PMC 1069.18]MEC4887992.1 chemotaxis protein CheW [Scytonema sp. PMC 1070.18]